ncbi:portal protein [Methylorubrum thiocyanatum]|uniref:portal protein n=1 Tax=Methylorubrum thiocyanatum TaxID=47958 RepID=UPI003F7EA908
MEDENEKKPVKRSTLSEQDILNRVTVGLSKSQNFTASDIEQKRVAGLRLYKREPFPGDKRVEGRSSYVTSDALDNTEWLLANLMALFDSQDRVVQFSPNGPEDEALAEQQTDVVNFVVTQGNNHALVLHDWLKNGLIGGLGIVTAAYYREKTWKPAKLLEGVATNQLIELASSDRHEILEAGEPYSAPGMEMIPGIEVRDLKVREARIRSRVQLHTLPVEDFFVSADASFDYGSGGISAALQGYKRTLPRAELLEMGYDAAKVAKIPSAASDPSDYSQERNRDQGHNDGTGDVEEEVEVYEVFMRIDANGDGVRELLHLTIGGAPSGGSVLLGQEEVEYAPFAAFVPYMMPNTLNGMSVGDLVGKDQRLKSMFIRGINDNLQQVLRPQRIVAGDGVNIDDLLNSGPDDIIRVTNKDALDYNTTPFVGQQAFGMLQMLDQSIEHRTGVGPNLMGVDANALQNTTATASSQRQTMSQLRVELMARMFAETGYRYLFRIVTSLLMANAEDTKDLTLRLRNAWVPYGTDQWDPDLDIKTNITFGITDKPQKVAAANALLQMQFTAIKEGSGLSDMGKVYNTLAVFTENSGFKNVERFWNDPAKMQQPAGPPQGQQPDPAAQAEQAKMQAEMQKMQIELQMKQAQHQAEMEMERERHEHRLQLEWMKFEAQQAMRQQEIGAETQLKGMQIMSQQNIQPQIRDVE